MGPNWVLVAIHPRKTVVHEVTPSPNAQVPKLWLGSFGVLTVSFSVLAITVKRGENYCLGLRTVTHCAIHYSGSIVINLLVSSKSVMTKFRKI